MAGTRLGAATRQIGRLFDGGTVTGLADPQLLDRFVARGDEIAFTALVERHGPMVLRVCRAILRDATQVEDAFQATFLVLIRKAATIRGREALGAWLHRVAYRIAVQSRIEANRTRKHEAPLGDAIDLVADRSTSSDHARRTALHEELARLPEKYRRPIVLCYLEGLTHAQAAAELGWGEATVRRRLSDARELLHSRLARQGFTPAIGLALIEGLAKESSAAVPRAWVNALAKAAATMPAGKIAAGGGISAAAAALARASLAGLFAQSAKAIVSAAALLMAIGMVGSHSIPAGLAQVGNDEPKTTQAPTPKQAAPPSKPAPPKPEDRTKPVTFAGIVVDPEGKPFEGAEIVLSSPWLRDQSRGPSRAESGPDGKFRFEVPIVEFGRIIQNGRMDATLLASAEGYAFGMANFRMEGDTLTLRLARDDVPIEGRIVDQAGKPVAGADIAVRTVQASEEEDLTRWLAGLKQLGAAYDADDGFLRRSLIARVGYPPISLARSDADGRFRITGIGRERVAELHIEGPSIETVHVRVRTRPGETIRLPAYKGFRLDEPIIIYGSSFTHIAGPSRMVEGTVRDQDTRKPLAGIMIHGEHSLGNPMEYISAVTDAEGRYHLKGRASRNGKDILAVAPCDFPYPLPEKLRIRIPNDSLPYLRAQLKVPDAPGDGPIRLDIGLKRGVYVTGRVLNKETGRPAYARIEYFVYSDNPQVKQAPGFRRAMTHGQSTDADGDFSLVAFPGPGVITARGWSDDYRFGVGIEESKRVDESGFLNAYPQNPVPTNYHTLAEIDPAEGTKMLSQNLLLDPGRTLALNVVGPDGRPLAGALIAGLKDMGYWEPEPSPETTSYKVVGLKPGKERRITARHDAKHLVAELILKGDETGPATIKLEPWVEITGRILPPDGQPWPDGMGLSQSRGNSPSLPWPMPLAKDGRFRVVGLIPNRKYGFDLYADYPPRISAGIIPEVSVRPGEVKDLGDIVVKPPKSP